MVIGRYTIEAEIGRGQMGVVYLATDPRLERPVAIKTFRLPDGLSDAQKREFQERFLREARAAAGLSHPGIVTVFDSSEDEASGDPFIAMEYIEGRTLRQLLDDEGRPTTDSAFEIAAVLAEALHTAHEAGIVHRDVKPGNILVRRSDGGVKIADFGVVRYPKSDLTQTGMTVGSPAYMSPEHIREGRVDARSDLFSLAVILYEMLCGRRPFEGEELATLAYAIAHEEPVPLTRHVSGLPVGIDAFFERALAKNPDRRFANGLEFAAALKSLMKEAPGHERTAILERLPAAVFEREPTASSPAIALPGDDDGAPAPGIHPADAEEFDDEPARPGGARRWVVASVVLLVLLLGARWISGGETSVEIHGKSSVRKGTLTLTVDGREVYTRELDAGSRKGARFFRKALGIEEESFSKSIAVTPGKHVIVARLQAFDGRELSDQVVVDLERGESLRLRLSAGRAYGAPLSIRSD